MSEESISEENERARQDMIAAVTDSRSALSFTIHEGPSGDPVMTAWDFMHPDHKDGMKRVMYNLLRHWEGDLRVAGTLHEEVGQLRVENEAMRMQVHDYPELVRRCDLLEDEIHRLRTKHDDWGPR